MTWISVSDSLPKLEQNVLACTIGDVEPLLLKYSYVKSYDRSGKIIEKCDPGFCRDLDHEDFSWPEREFYEGITHWMPLPEPPKDTL